MNYYACVRTDDPSWNYVCMADSRRAAMAKFKADPECGCDMSKYNFKVGLLSDVLPDIASDSLIMSTIKNGYSGRLIAIDRGV